MSDPIDEASRYAEEHAGDYEISDWSNTNGYIALFEDPRNLLRDGFNAGRAAATPKRAAAVIAGVEAENARLREEIADLNVWWGRSVRATASRKAERDALQLKLDAVKAQAEAITQTTRENGSDFERGQENFAKYVLTALSTTEEES